MDKIAYLGLGVMGTGMAGTLLDAGHPVAVWNRSDGPARKLAGKGATVADSPAACVKGVDVVMLCLANDSAVEEVVFGPDGILGGIAAGQIVCDASTVHPDLSRREGAAFAEKDVKFLDTPVFGSKKESAAGGLWVLAGGDRAAFDRVKPILQTLGETVHYMGNTGSGTSMKLVGNLIVALQLEALGEAMVLATKAGLNPTDVLEVLGVTDFKSPILTGTGKSLVERDFSVSFQLKHLLKDANLIDRLATQLNAPTPAMTAVRETIKAAVNRGFGDENASAMIKVLEKNGGATVGEKN